MSGGSQLPVTPAPLPGDLMPQQASTHMAYTQDTHIHERKGKINLFEKHFGIEGGRLLILEFGFLAVSR